jgi:hypothetical protein
MVAHNCGPEMLHGLLLEDIIPARAIAARIDDIPTPSKDSGSYFGWNQQTFRIPCRIECVASLFSKGVKRESFVHSICIEHGYLHFHSSLGIPLCHRR